MNRNRPVMQSLFDKQGSHDLTHNSRFVVCSHACRFAFAYFVTRCTSYFLCISYLTLCCDTSKVNNFLRHVASSQDAVGSRRCVQRLAHLAAHPRTCQAGCHRGKDSLEIRSRCAASARRCARESRERASPRRSKTSALEKQADA